MRLRRTASLALSATTAVTVVGLGLGATPASANHSWGNYHWARSGAITLELRRSLSSSWTAAASTANSDWNASEVVDNYLTSGGTTNSTRRNCPSFNGGVRLCNYTYGNTGWSGLASINIDGNSHITNGTVKLNDTYEAGASSAERQLVMCQEIGHTFGLDHQDENQTNANLNTCMDYTNSPQTNQHPNQHDYEQLTTIYGHNDSYNTDPSAAATRSTSSTTVIRTGRQVVKVLWTS